MQHASVATDYGSCRRGMLERMRELVDIDLRSAPVVQAERGDEPQRHDPRRLHERQNVAARDVRSECQADERGGEQDDCANSARNEGDAVARKTQGDRDGEQDDRRGDRRRHRK
jgi:hypothetical protein